MGNGRRHCGERSYECSHRDAWQLSTHKSKRRLLHCFVNINNETRFLATFRWRILLPTCQNQLVVFMCRLASNKGHLKHRSECKFIEFSTVNYSASTNYYFHIPFIVEGAMCVHSSLASDASFIVFKPIE